jgi:hypothetical protein
MTQLRRREFLHLAAGSIALPGLSRMARCKNPRLMRWPIIKLANIKGG